MSGGTTPVGAMLRRPYNLVRRRIIGALHDAGFTDLHQAHLAVLAYPGPAGQRPGVLATRADASKQAMNHLLGQLESVGYLVRAQDPADRRTRVVQLTARGKEVVDLIADVLDDVDTEWREVLGDRGFAELRRALARLDDHIEDGPGA